MSNKYSNIFFDWSGVIADDSGDEFIRGSLLSVGASDIQINKILKNELNEFVVGRISEDEYWDKIRKNYNLDVNESIVGYFNDWVGITPNDDMIQFVDELKSKKFNVSLVSNIISPCYEIIKKQGSYDLFANPILSCAEGLAKPDEEIFKLALLKNDTNASQTIFVDDNENNIKTAKKLGFKTIIAENSTQIINDIKKLID